MGWLRDLRGIPIGCVPKSAVEYIGAILLTDGTSPPESDNEMISDLAVIALKYGWTINQFNGALCGYYARSDQERDSDNCRTIKSDKEPLERNASRI